MQGAFFAAGVDKGAPTGAGSLCEHTTLRTLSLCELYKQRRALAVEKEPGCRHHALLVAAPSPRKPRLQQLARLAKLLSPWVMT